MELIFDIKTQISHKDLCLITAKKFNKHVTLYEYQSYVSPEHPDVLVYEYNGTTLFEIKTSRADFLADFKKDCRKNTAVLMIQKNYYT